MNVTEAKIIKLVSQVPPLNRNVFFIAAKLNKSYSGIYNYVRILEVKGHLTKVKSGNNKTFFQTNADAIALATEVLTNVPTD